MSREMELIQKIDEHIEKAGGLYGLELPDSDLRIIQAALLKVVAVEPIDKEIGYGDTALCCPACGKPVTNYFAPWAQPAYCQFCGQALKKRGGEPPSEEQRRI